jgi:hypothetical protein
MSFKLSEYVDFRTKKKIDSSVKATIASLENESPDADTPNSRFQRLLQFYKMLKPLFAFILSFPLIPQMWRTGLGVIVQLLESFVTIGPDITVQFKAGKDLITSE